MHKTSQLIEKYKLKLNTVQSVIKTSNCNEDILTAQAVERFLKEFIGDLEGLKQTREVYLTEK